MDDLTPFERECLDMIRQLETVALPRAQQRQAAAERAVARVTAEIEAFRTTMAVRRELLSGEPRP